MPLLRLTFAVEMKTRKKKRKKTVVESCHLYPSSAHTCHSHPLHKHTQGKKQNAAASCSVWRQKHVGEREKNKGKETRTASLIVHSVCTVSSESVKTPVIVKLQL